MPRRRAILTRRVMKVLEKRASLENVAGHQQGERASESTLKQHSGAVFPC